MKKIVILICVVLCGLLPAHKASAQADEIAQLMLNVEKLAQFKQILADMKKGYEILNGGYNTVKNISEGNFNLHKTFLDGLMQVSPSVRNYKRVGDIINYQLIMVKEYQGANDRFSQDGNFNAQEKTYINHVYDNLLNESLRNLGELTSVISGGQLRMSDDERIQAIDRIYLNMDGKLNFLRQFNNETKMLAIQRAKEKRDVETLRKIYGINN